MAAEAVADAAEAAAQEHGSLLSMSQTSPFPCNAEPRSKGWAEFATTTVAPSAPGAAAATAAAT
eukprot:1537508-Alexandrium_andersonii.AAC.1